MESWQEQLLRIIDSRHPKRILEAGGGANTRIPLTGAHYTVVDLSPEALARTDYAQEKLLGDLQTFDYGDRRFDAAIFWDVLEHVENPAAALDRACAALDPGGIVVVKGPVLRSMKGLVVRFTPFWFHVAYYRIVQGSRTAGTPGHSPYPTEHAPSADPEALKRLLQEKRFTVEHYETFVHATVWQLQQKFPFTYRLYTWAATALRAVTLGRYGGRDTDFVLVAVNSGAGP